MKIGIINLIGIGGYIGLWVGGIIEGNTPMMWSLILGPLTLLLSTYNETNKDNILFTIGKDK